MSSAIPVLPDRYEVERELGRGGMSVVYLAKDRQVLSKRVVVKVLLEEISDDPWVRKKLLQETEALARIDHPGVVGVLDTGETAEGKQFLVMQYVEGVTLREALDAGAMDLARAAGLIRQIGQALAAAHDKGVWHRDLKPGNVMLQSLAGGEERIVLIDFGIAGIQNSVFATEKTQVAGSSSYMAPEQFAGAPSASSDTYALGAVAYEMLTGEKAFPQATFVHLVSEETARPTPPRDLRADIPEAAAKAIQKALSFRPDARHASLRDFSEELYHALTPVPGGVTHTRRAVEEGALDGSGDPARPRGLPALPRKSGRRPLVALAAVLATLLIGAAVAAWLYSSQDPLQLAYSIDVQRVRDGKPYGRPFRVPGEMVFERDYEIAIEVTSPQSGYLYILNEGAHREAGRRTFNLLVPRDGGSARHAPASPTRIPPAEKWFQFDAATGKEMLYLIWSREVVAELESVKTLPTVQSGAVVVQDADRLERIRRFLADNTRRAVNVSRDEQARRTNLEANAKILVHAVPLEHQ